MSQTSKIVLGIAVLVVVALGVYYYLHVKQSQTASNANGESPAEVTSLPSGSNTSDAAIDQDLSSIDTQLQGVKSDNADVNTSVSAAAAQ